MNRNAKAMLPAALIATLFLPGCSGWRGETPGAITVSGNIELTQVNIAFKVPGRIVELPLAEGQAVTAGTVLARIDSTQLERQRERDQAALVAAGSLEEQLKTAIEFQKATIAADADLRAAELQQAEARLRDLLAGSRKQEVQTAEAVLQDARNLQQQAQRDWDRAQTLYKTEDISTAQYDQYRTRFESTRAALRQAEERLALVVEGPRKEEVEAARAQVARARAAVRLSETARIDLRRREQELATRRADIERARAQVAFIDAQIQDTTVTSPIGGVVLVKSAENGEVVAPGTTLATIGDIDHPWLRAYINETDLGRVKLGSQASVVTDSFPGKVYKGRVSFISSEAEFTPKQIQTPEERVKLVYRIKIELENPAHELKANMPADAEIVVDAK